MILFWIPNMTIWCKHVHRLELQKFLNFCAAHLPVRLDIETKFPYFLFLTWLSIIRNQEGLHNKRRPQINKIIWLKRLIINVNFVIAVQSYELYYIYFWWYYHLCAHFVNKYEDKSLFDTIFYFLMQVRSTSIICKWRDIAVILSEKGGGAVDILLI